MRRGRIGCGVVMAVLLVGAQCTTRPRITVPANETRIDAAGTPVAIDLVRAPGPNAVVAVRLFRAVDEAPVTSIDVTGLLAQAGASLTGSLGPAELREGRNQLLVTVDADGDGAIDQQAWSTFSWEPNVDTASADRCDPLDPSYCLYPFPNDHFTAADPSTPTGRRVALHADSLPRNVGDKPVSAAKWNALDGWSVGPMLLFQSAALDLDATGAPPITDVGRSLEPSSPTVLLDTETGQRVLHWVERESYYDVPDEERPLIVRVGVNLPNARRHVMAIRGARDAAGDPLPPSRLFRIYRDAIPSYDPAIEGRRAQMEAIFADLAAAGVARGDLYLAWDFTTQSVHSLAGKMLHMRDEAFAALGSAAPSFTVTEVVEPSDSRIFRDVRGTFQVPLYLTSQAPGSLLNLDADNVPFTTGAFFTADFRCMVPYAATTNGALPVHPARPSLYGHGLLGSHNEVSAGNVRDMASEHNFVMCATKWTGMAEDDYNTALQILADFTNFPKFSERMHQGILNFLFLGRLMIHANGLVSHPAFQVEGQPLIDRTELFYDGNSQGAISGGGLASYAQDYTRAVLGVPGMNYSTLLNRSVDFDDFNLFFTISYTSNFDRQLLLSLIEMLWEQAEVNGGARHLSSDPYPNTPAKKILLQMAYGDHQTANVSVEVEARSIGAKIRLPAVQDGKPIPDVVPWFGIEPIESFPYDGSALVVWDSGNPPPPTTNTPPRFDATDPAWAGLLPCPLRFDGDPHECPRRQAAARLQKSEFLKTNGAVVDTCGAGPCLAP
jgi:hypothetical protein